MLFSSTRRLCYVMYQGYVFLSFATNIGENIGKNKIKSLNSKYSQKRLDHAK